MAAALIAMNDVYGKKFFKVDEEECSSPRPARRTGRRMICSCSTTRRTSLRDTLKQGRGLRALAQGRGSLANANLVPADTPSTRTTDCWARCRPDELGSLWTPWNPAYLLRSEPLSALLQADYPPNTGDEFHMVKYIQRFFFESQTSVVILSNANGRHQRPPHRQPPGKEHRREPQAEILTGSQTRGVCDW